jgi:hypothetical protein
LTLHAFLTYPLDVSRLNAPRMRITDLAIFLVVLSAGGPGLMADDKAKAGKSISLVVAEKEDPILL